MKKLLIILLVTASHFAFGMKQQPKRNDKSLGQEWTVNLPLNLLENPDEPNVKKAVQVIAPHGLSLAKVERYFAKNGNKLQGRVKQFMDLCVVLMYNKETEAVADDQYPDAAQVNPVLYRMLRDPKSIFEFKLESPSIFLSRDIGGDPKAWHFSELIEITLDEALPQKGRCGQLTVQCHHDQAGVLDKVWVSELERFYAKIRGPRILIAGKETFTQAELEHEGMIAQVETSDDRLRTLAYLFVVKHPKYAHLFKKK